MTIETWKAEFYPTEANTATGSDKEAIDHCLRKWRGLEEENLKRHRVELDKYAFLLDEEWNQIHVKSHECALCWRYDFNEGEKEDRCDECPVGKYGTECEGIDSEFNALYYDCDPKPMIALLDKLSTEYSKDA